MRFDYQFALQNIYTNAEISHPPFDIHKSKLEVVERHFIKSNKTYNCLVFSIKLNNNYEKFFFKKEKQFLDTNAY
jgi:hypothetical protein